MKVNGINSIRRILAKNSPTILTGIGVAGLITTAIMAVKATPKALKILEQEEYARTQGPDDPDILLSKKDVILLTWKCYVPAAVMGSITIACIIGANKINLRRNAALAGLYSLSETAFKEYKSKVVENIGSAKERKMKDEIAKDKISKNPVIDEEIIYTGNGDTLCYDALSGRYFKSDIEFIRRIANELNRNMLTDMSITLNEFYDKLGLRYTKVGEWLAWHVDDGLFEVEFSSQLTEKNVPCLVVDFSEEPRYIYKD